MNKKSILIVVVVSIVAIALYFISSYNSIVGLEIDSKTQWSNVETAYQRRADLIPNLVNTVKGYAEFEKSVFVEVTEARSKATSLTISADELTPENMARFQEAQSQLSGSLSRLLATFERYPELKANQNFLELQAQLEGTENRIAVERRKFNNVTGDYNKKVQTFPGAITAKIFGFEEKGTFEAAQGAEEAPKVEF